MNIATMITTIIEPQRRSIASSEPTLPPKASLVDIWQGNPIVGYSASTATGSNRSLAYTATCLVIDATQGLSVEAEVKIIINRTMNSTNASPTTADFTLSTQKLADFDPNNLEQYRINQSDQNSYDHYPKAVNELGTIQVIEISVSVPRTPTDNTTILNETLNFDLLDYGYYLVWLDSNDGSNGYYAKEGNLVLEIL